MAKTFEDLEKDLRVNLTAIRKVLDEDVIDSDIINVQNKLLALTQLSGLAAESKGLAKKLLEVQRLKSFMEVQPEKLPPTMAMAKINSMCSDQLGMLDYADRINAGLTHGIEGLRSVLSLYKSELENSLKA